MRPNPTRPTPAGFTGYMSEHRFRSMLLACALALASELIVVYEAVGFAPIWAVPAVP